jgi:hypothetical protein
VSQWLFPKFFAGGDQTWLGEGCGLPKFAAGAAPYPYVRVNDGEQESRVVDIAEAHEQALAAPAEHPVLAGQSCDASVHYTGTAHAGPLEPVRSRTSGLQRVTCRAHAERARAHGVKLVAVDIEFEHGHALAMDGIRTAAGVRRSARLRAEDVPDATADRVHAAALSSLTYFRPTGRETEIQALSRKLRQVSEARDNALRDRASLAKRYDELCDSERAAWRAVDSAVEGRGKLLEQTKRQARILAERLALRDAAESERIALCPWPWD